MLRKLSTKATWRSKISKWKDLQIGKAARFFMAGANLQALTWSLEGWRGAYQCPPRSMPPPGHHAQLPRSANLVTKRLEIVTTLQQMFSQHLQVLLFVLSLWKLSVARTKRSWKKFLAIPFCKRNPNITSLKNLKHTHTYIHMLAPLKPIFLTFWLVFTVFLVYFAINTKPYMLNWFSGSLTLVSDDVSDMCRCEAIFAWYLLYFWTLHCDLWYMYIYININKYIHNAYIKNKNKKNKTWLK